MALSAGTNLGPYQILAAIGAGGMGDVYKARDTRLERDVAVKVLSAALTDSRPARERFQREARAVAALQHPNICTIYDVGETDDGHAFLVMELLQGETLQQRLARGPLDVPLLVEMGSALADGLDAAHAAGIIHRDIKPSNIFLTARGPKLLDFGVAKATPRPINPESSTRTAALKTLATTPGTAVGTLAYMSPEQLRGEELDARTDLFSLGLVFYEMATGRPPFTGATGVALAAAVLHQDPPAPSTVRRDLPSSVNDVILKALEKDRSLRYAHASEMRTDLQRVKRDSSERMPPRAQPVAAGPWTRFWPALAVGGVTLAVAVGWSLYSPGQASLTDKETIVLADFANTTGDPVFDGTLRQGLAVHLQQSPFLSLASDARIGQALRLMGQARDAPLTPALAREVCERTGGGAVLEGSIASLGSRFVLGLRATNCGTGDVLAENQAQAATKEEVLNALGTVASALRTRLGESLTTVQRHNTPLEEATTTSLEALKAYSTAVNVAFVTGNSAALPHLRQAIELDDNFAMAHAQIGLLYSVIGESVLAAESTAKAYRLRDRATDRERFFITATYHRQVTGNLEQAQQTFELWARTYPRDITPRALSAGFTYQGSGKYERSIEEATIAIALDPDRAPGYLNAGFSNLYLDRLGEVSNVLQHASEHQIDGPDFLILRYYLAFLKGDQAAMDREFALAAGDAAVEDFMLHSRALALARSGKRGMARIMARRAVDMARAAGQRERAAIFQAGEAVWEAVFGDAPAARRNAAAALELSTGRDVSYAAAFALALAGDISRPQALAADLERRFPEDTSVRLGYLPTLHGLVMLQQGKPAEAIRQLESALPNELAVPALNFVGFYGSLYPAYVRGQAHMAMHRYAEAAAEFRKLVDRPGLVLSDPVESAARLQMARALASAGNTTDAKAAYGELLKRWADADDDLALVKAARAESLKLP